MSSCECIPVTYKENITPECTKLTKLNEILPKSSASMKDKNIQEEVSTTATPSSSSIDSFIIPKWDELSVICWSNELIKELNQPPGPEDAVGLFSLITKLRSVLKYHTEVYQKQPEILSECTSVVAQTATTDYSFMNENQDPTLIAATNFLTKEISSLRSAISRHATIASTELVNTAGKYLIQLPLSMVDNFINTLLIRSSSDKKFIKLEAESTLKILANLKPSTSSLLLSYLRHSSSKSRVMSTFSAELANCCLPHIPRTDVLQLDLSHISSLVAAYITSKSAEARTYASQLSYTFCSIRGYTEWSQTVKNTCKPIEAVGLLKHLTPLSAIEGINDINNSTTVGSVSVLTLTNNNTLSSFINSPAKRVIPLCEYLREQRSSQKRNTTITASPGGLPTINMLASPVPITSFSPGIPLSVNHRRISKSPVLVLKRKSLLVPVVSGGSNNNSNPNANDKYYSTIIETPIDNDYTVEENTNPLVPLVTKSPILFKKSSFGTPTTPILATPTRGLPLVASFPSGL